MNADAADDLLLVQLKSLGVQLKNLDEFTAETLCATVIRCFARLQASKINGADQFVDLAFLKKQDLKEATHRFKACQKFVKYLQQLGYFYDVSFTTFTNPNKKETRKLLGFFFELIFNEAEDDSAAKNARPTNQMEELLKRRLNKFSNKPWILPDFYDGQKRGLLIGGDIISVQKDIDFDRVAASKSKKVKGVYKMMLNTFSITRAAEEYRQGVHALGKSLQASSWAKGQGLLVSERTDMFRNEDEEEGDDAGKPGLAAINKAGIMGSIMSQMQSVQTASGTLDVNLPDSAGATNTKTIAEILEEREQELKDLEQFKDMKNSQFVDALAADMGTAGGSTVLNLPSASLGSAGADQTAEDGQEGGASGAAKEGDVANEIQAKFEADTENLVRENEETIAAMVKTLEGLKAEIGSSQNRVEQMQTQKNEFEEEQKELADNLKKAQKTGKRKKEVLNELEKLAGQDLRVLQGEVGEINNELEQLKEEWEEYKKPINDEIFEKKQEIADKRVEYQYKQDKIKALKQEFKAVVADIEHKKRVHQFMQEELASMPKDINRNQYLKRINEIIKSLKSQNGEIRKILQEIQDIQGGTTSIIGDLKKIDVEVEDLVYKDAVKDKTSKEVYAAIQDLKGKFDSMISNDQEQSKLKTQTREVQNKMDDFRIKYKNMAEIEKLKQDLQAVLQENAALQQQATGQGQ